MTLISYAQNFEDVMLWRALKDVENGFYIDVGANDPTVDSVTKAFYDRGWSGMNIEPLPSHYASLVTERPRDMNLLCAIGEREDEIDLWECEVRGWATASAAVIEMHERAGHTGKYHKVALHTLANVCAKHAPQDIHFLKIDVEGFERAVIAGADFQRYRPWIIVVEATKPNSPEASHQEWEEALFEADYLFAYFDGLNRFYIARERADLRVFFDAPPNVFDDFKIASLHIAEAQLVQAEIRIDEVQALAKVYEVRLAQAEELAKVKNARLAQAEELAKVNETRLAQAEELAKVNDARLAQAEELAKANEIRAIEAEKLGAAKTEHVMRLEKSLAICDDRVRKAESQIAVYEKKVAKSEKELSEIINSNSWRLTAPLRRIRHAIRCFGRHTYGDHYDENSHPQRFSRVFGNPIGGIVAFLVKYPRLKKRITPIVRRVPALEKWLMRKHAEKKLGTHSFPYAPMESELEVRGCNVMGSYYSVEVCKAQRGVEEIISNIRVELAQNKGE